MTYDLLLMINEQCIIFMVDVIKWFLWFWFFVKYYDFYDLFSIWFNYLNLFMINDLRHWMIFILMNF